MKEKKKVFVTGGHATPALAVLEEIVQRSLSYEVVWIGRIRAFEDDTHESEEYRLVQERGIRFLPLTTGRLTRVLSPASILSWFKIPVGLVQAIRYCRAEHPDIVVSFGGYIALPVAMAGWLSGVPVVTHEQTSSMGLANRIISAIAARVCVSNSSMLKEVQGKGVYTGLPLRSVMYHSQSGSSIKLPENIPVLFVTGGSTGSESVNSVLFNSLEKILDRFIVVHQTGKQGIEKGNAVRDSLPAQLRKRYYPYAYLSDSEIAWLFQKSKIVIARSGANTVGELAVSGAVALFIPLPWAVGDEQKKNAQMLVERGSAVMLEQRMLTPDTLDAALHDIELRYEDLKQHARKNKTMYPNDAAPKVVDTIVSLIP